MISKKDIADYLKDCGILEKWHTKTLEEFTNDDKVLRIFTKFLNNPKPQIDDAVGMYLYGGNGTGKTHLMNVAFRELILEYHYKAQIISFSSLVNMYVEAWRDVSKRGEFKRLIVTPKILGIEELGKEYKVSLKDENESFVNVCLDTVIRTRIQINKPTWFTTNLLPSQLKDKYTPDIASMLKESCLALNVSGEDYRNKIREQNKGKYLC